MGSRRDFFRRLSGEMVAKIKEDKPLFLRPPYNQDRELFDKECIKCSSKACIGACNEKIIVLEDISQTPILNFNSSGCTFCQDCANACDRDVLIVSDEFEKIDATFLINKDSCLAHNKSICFACKEPCIDDAILFRGMFEPIIDMDRCTSCGFCISRCPTNAIEYIIRR